MSVHTSIAVPTRERRRWPYVAAAVLVVAAVVAVVLAITLPTSTSSTDTKGSKETSASIAPARHDPSAVSKLMALTPADLAGGAFGAGHALQGVQNSPTLAQVLASMSPATRRYTERIMRLTFAQLAAGAAGSP